MNHKREYTAEEIEKIFPFDNIIINKEIALGHLMTSDIGLALQYIWQGKQISVWGGFYRGKRMFLFEDRIEDLQCPF